MPTQLSAPAVSVNNEVVSVVPNSVKFTEGKGEQTMRAASSGGGQTEQVYSDNVETAFSMVSFEIYATVESIALAREWKSNRNVNVVQVAGSTPEGRLTRTFSQAALLSNYEVALGSDTTIPIEFSSQPSI